MNYSCIMKICNECNKSLTLDQFGIDSKMKDGYNSKCKGCRNSIFRYKYTLSDNQKQHNNTFSEETLLKSKLKNNKAIIGTNIIDDSILEFPSFTSAMEKGFHRVKVSESIRKNKPYKNYMWRYK